MPAERIVFSGVGKRREEIRAALEAGVRSLNVESLGELDVIAEEAAALGVVAPISVRLNPDVEAGHARLRRDGLRAEQVRPRAGGRAGGVRARGRRPGARSPSGCRSTSARSSSTSGRCTPPPRRRPSCGASSPPAPRPRRRRRPRHRLRRRGGRGGSSRTRRAGRRRRRPRRRARRRARPLARRPGWDVRHARPLREGRPGTPDRGLRRRHERPDPPGALRRAAPDRHPRRGGRAEGRVDVVGPVCETGDFFALDVELPLPRAG